MENLFQIAVALHIELTFAVQLYHIVLRQLLEVVVNKRHLRRDHSPHFQTMPAFLFKDKKNNSITPESGLDENVFELPRTVAQH